MLLKKMETQGGPSLAEITLKSEISERARQEFETRRFNEGYEEDVKTLFTVVSITIILMK
jgi:hypothetical protein